MAEQRTVQEEYFRGWCEAWAPGTYDRLTEEERERLREMRRTVSQARQIGLANLLRGLGKRAEKK